MIWGWVKASLELRMCPKVMVTAASCIPPAFSMWTGKQPAPISALQAALQVLGEGFGFLQTLSSAPCLLQSSPASPELLVRIRANQRLPLVFDGNFATALPAEQGTESGHWGQQAGSAPISMAWSSKTGRRSISGADHIGCRAPSRAGEARSCCRDDLGGIP